MSHGLLTGKQAWRRQFKSGRRPEQHDILFKEVISLCPILSGLIVEYAMFGKVKNIDVISINYSDDNRFFLIYSSTYQNVPTELCFGRFS